MPQGDKSAYTNKQRRQAEHIEEGYEKRGIGRRRQRNAPGAQSTPKPAAERNQALAEPATAAPQQRRAGRRGDVAKARRSLPALRL